MKKIIFYFVAILFAGIGFASCSDEDNLSDEQLSVATFYPDIFMEGTEVTITGTAMNEVTDVVFPGGVSATSIESVDSRTLIVKAPAGASETGAPLVIKANGAEISSRQVIRKAHPTVLRYNPVDAATYSDLSIEGTDLLLVDVVTFDNGEDVWSVQALDFVRKSNSSVKVYLPKETPLGDAVNVSVTFKNGESLSLHSLKIEQGGGQWVEKEIVLPTSVPLPLAMSSAWSESTKIEASNFANVKVGDVLRAYVSGKTGGWQQIAFKNGSSWAGMIPEWEALAITDDEFAAGFVEITISEDVLAQMQADGLIVSGCNYTLEKVVLVTLVWEDVTGGDSSETVLYEGDPVVMGNWSGSITSMGAVLFADAKIGDVIRVYIQDPVEGWQQGSFKNGSSWAGITDALGVIELTDDDFSAGYYEGTIDDVILPQLVESGLIVSGCNHTATKVTLISK